MTTPTPWEAAKLAVKLCAWPQKDDHYADRDKLAGKIARAAILAFIGALDTNDAERKAIGDAFRSGILSVADRDVPFTSDEARNAGARAILTHLKSKVET